jgi:putative ubiquitin-RnfH superfamily antitoxin RatB of RatAB toxin-antitoxin module
LTEIGVEVVYALPGGADVRQVRLAAGATAADAIRAAGTLERHPELKVYDVGIFGARTAPDTKLKNGDRVEIYRPLQVDPKEARRRRAAKLR